MRIDRPHRLTRLDWQRFSRFFVVGDLRRPQTLAPGLTPAQTRARGRDLMDSNSARAGLHAAAPFPLSGKENECRRVCRLSEIGHQNGHHFGHQTSKDEF